MNSDSDTFVDRLENERDSFEEQLKRYFQRVNQLWAKLAKTLFLSEGANKSLI